MESQTFEQRQPPEPLPSLQQSRPQSDDINAISRISRAERSRNPFLLISLYLGFSSWIVSLVSQAIVAATISNATVRILWFGTIIQFILLVEIFEVIISGNMFAYAVQISILAALATVFAVQGVDSNIYSSSRAQKAIGAGWLVTAIIDLIWIIYFTSPSDSHFFRLTNDFTLSRPFSRRSSGIKTVEKISRSQDAFVMSPANGSTPPGPGAEALMGLGLDADEFATLAPGDIDRLKEERMRSPEHTSGYDFDKMEPRRGSRTRSGGLWSNYPPSSQQGGPRATMSSGGTGGDGAGRDGALSTEHEPSVRPDSGTSHHVSPPETPPPPQPNRSKTTRSRVSRSGSQSAHHAQGDEPIAQWRAEALFDYMGAADDPNELSFKKGEHLNIVDKSGKWWEARSMDGRKGIAPSNYLRLLI